MERKTLAMHAIPISAELRACERALSCIIEGVGPDQLLIRYSLKGGESSRSTHEVSFVLDVSSSSYKGAPLPIVSTCTSQQWLIVLTSTPPLPTLPMLLDQLNESRDVFAFIKCVRQAYVKLFS